MNFWPDPIATMGSLNYRLQPMDVPRGPLRIHSDTVRPDWIDYNGHMNDGYYVVAFTRATDAVQDLVGLDQAYRDRTGCSIYTVEAHLLYLNEVKEDAQIDFESWVLGVDEKRLHLFHTMLEGENLAATHELMLLHVDQALGKTVPFPDHVLSALDGLRIDHQGLRLPEQVGSTIRTLTR